jgi:hypothetical protein
MRDEKLFSIVEMVLIMVISLCILKNLESVEIKHDNNSPVLTQEIHRA